MRLRKPCEHGLYDQHVIPTGIYGHGPSTCPGGEFLTDDALDTIIEALRFDGDDKAEAVLAILGADLR